MPLSYFDKTTQGEVLSRITNDVDEAVLMADRIIPLTVGPEATLAKEFKVNMERPRDRSTLNDHPEYMRLKREITHFMTDLNAEAKEQKQASDITMPDVTPKDFRAPSGQIRFKLPTRSTT